MCVAQAAAHGRPAARRWAEALGAHDAPSIMVDVKMMSMEGDKHAKLHEEHKGKY